MNDVKAMDYLIYEHSAYYIFDRGYVDYTKLFKITVHSAFFVIRVKSNLQFNRMYSLKIDRSTGVLCDQIGRLKGFYGSKEYPEKLRWVKFYDNESKRTFVFFFD